MARRLFFLLAFALTWPANAFADKWTAIAYSKKTGAHGKAWGFSTENIAKRRALDECGKHADDCAVVVAESSPNSGPETCVAVVALTFERKESGGAIATTRSPVWASAANRDDAAASALQACHDGRLRTMMHLREATSECKTVATSCSSRP